MDLLLPLISLLLVTGGGGGWLASFADAATPNSEETPKAYWEAVLPGIPVPPAIINLLLAHQNGHSSLDGVTINPNNLKFLKGARKIGSNYEKHKPEPDHDDKHVHISSQVEDSLKENSIPYGSQGEEDIEKGISDLKTFPTRHATLKVKGEGSHHAHSQNHANKKQADVFFFQGMLRPGSLITPTIPPTTSLLPCRRFFPAALPNPSHSPWSASPTS